MKKTLTLNHFNNYNKKNLVGCLTPHVFVASTSKLNAALMKSGTQRCGFPLSS